MTDTSNPFSRGYQNLHIVRTLFITHEDDCPPVWRPLHTRQTHLPDEQVALFPCLFGEDFALITEGQAIPATLVALCPVEGIVRTVVYAIVGDNFDGTPMHIGDTFSAVAASEVVRRLTFETGIYGRVWEISTAHVSETTSHFLCELADMSTPTYRLFTVFRIPWTPGIGIKLIATPWTDKHLLAMDNLTAEQLHMERRAAGMPEDLIMLLRLAGEADVRILILDADAPIFHGLPIYDNS